MSKDCKDSEFSIGDQVTDPIYSYPVGTVKRLSDDGETAWVEWYQDEKPLPIWVKRLIHVPVRVRLSNFETVLPIWREKLWPGRDSPINPVSSMAYLGGYDMQIYAYDPVFFVTECRDKIIGVISGFQTAPGWFRSRGVWVDSKLAKRGIGRALMNAVEKAALDRQCANLWTIPRQSAMPYYARMGFEQTSEWFDEGVEYGPNAYALKSLTFA